ncbi:MAG: hypothetical protein R8L07_03375 [Alphaproteobacteria bacterium]|nr:hypothetical protein [Alphaproteobacteria bacterium]
MPQAIPIIVAVAAKYFASYAVASLVATAVSAIASYAMQSAMASKSGRGDGTGVGFGAAASNRTQTIRQPVVARRKASGTVILGTVLTYYAQTENKKYHHLVLTVCDGPVSGFGTVWLNDEPINPEDIDGDGVVTRGRFADKVRIKFHTGATDQAADADLIAEVADLDSSFRGRGIAYIYLRVQWNSTILPSGLPSVRVAVRGSVEDPRTASTGYSDTAALIWRDYIADSTLGLGVHGATVARIESDALIAAANICDEIVDTNDKDATVEAVDTAGDSLALTDDRVPFFTGDRAEPVTTGTLPAGLSVATDYYVIVVNHARASADSPVRIQLATSLANARAGTAVTISDAGTGTHTIRKTGEPRYRASGMIDTERTPYEIQDDLLTAMVGVATYSGGKWRLLPGAYRAGTVEIDEDDLRGTLRGPTRYSRREAFNGCKGLYASPFNDGEPNEYPVVVSSALEAVDNDERIFDKFDQPMCISPLQAQRCAAQRLKRYRTGEIRIECRVSFAKGMRIRAGETVLFSNTRRGWVQRPMTVEAHALDVQEQEDGTPYLAFRLLLASTLSTDFDFDPATEETDVSPSARLTGSGVFDVDTPTLGTIASGTDHLFVKKDGTVVSRIHVPWTSITDEIVRNGGAVEVRFRQTGEADTAWLIRRQDDPSLDFVYLDPVEDDVSYDIQIRAVNGLGVASDWSSTSTHTVVGKTAAPSNVTGFTVQQNGAACVFKWDAISDADRAGYAIRYKAQGSFVWADATPVSEELIARGTTISTFLIPPGDWTFGIKAYDTSGNQSGTAATFNLTVSNSNDVVFSQAQAPYWSGTLDGFVKHWTGVLVPDSQNLASADGWETFDEFVPSPVATCRYTAPVEDLGFDADGVRVWAEIDSVLGPGETGGVADPVLSIDTRDDADAFDGFETWTVGTADFRHIKGRITVDTSKGLPVVRDFTLVCDVQERTESGSDETAAVSGTAVTFAQRFHTKPAVHLTADGDDRIAMKSAVTVTGFTAKVYDTAGNDVGGTFDWTATGA